MKTGSDYKVSRAARILLLVLSLCTFNCIAQPFSVKVATIPHKPLIFQKIKIKERYNDSPEVKKLMDQLLSAARRNGYLLAEFSAPDWNKTDLNLTLTLNSQYFISSLRNGNIPFNILAEAGYSQSLFEKRFFDYSSVNEVFEKIIAAYENKGYPFASIGLDSIAFKGDSISAVMVAEPGTLFQMDTVEVAGNAKISEKFLQNYLDIKTGDLYQEAKVNDIETRLNQLPFLRSIKPPQITFTGAQAHVVLFLEQENANQFDGIIGFLTDANTNKPVITGNLKLHLLNALKRGDSFNFDFRGLPGKSRSIDLGTAFPLIFSSPLGLDLNISLFKQDTSYQNLDFRVGLSYRIRRGSLKFFLHDRNGAPITNATGADVAASSLIGNISNLSYGLGISYRDVDLRSFKKNGININAEVEAGNKKVVSLQNKSHSNQYRFTAFVDSYLPVGPRAIVKFSNQTGLLVGRSFYENELYRLGGFSSLRGFDEQSILASKYSMLNLEYQFFLEKRSYLFAFTNGALVKYEALQSSLSSRPYGMGLGITLETGPGIFSLSYAVGKQKDIPLNLQSGKIHFGLVTFF